MSRLETAETTWLLEVVRGRDIGRRFAIRGPSSVLGAGVGAEAGIDLADQETGNMKRLAARQARLDVDSSGLAILDLDSPGGTFVNKKRVLSGSTQPLKHGDVIQLGGVQLQVVHGDVATKSSATESNRVAASTSGFVYKFPSGETCRTFDDILTLSAQRWDTLRDELTSGRLSAQLARTGRADLAPNPNTPGSPDERLDAWLRSLPTSKPCRPELDVHPARLMVRNPSGGSTRRTLRITNTGYGLLSYRVKADLDWLRVVGDSDLERSVVESAECVLEIRLPDDLSVRKSGICLVESNGGQAQIKDRDRTGDGRDRVFL